MSKKVYLIILKAGVFLSLISVFLVFRNLLFPYISSKQIFFNILIEILVVFWLAFIIKFPEYRPKKSWISFGLGAYLLAILVSSILGVDFNLSFWGDVERMLGFFHIFHFFLFYLIIITVFKDWKDWKFLLTASLAVASILGLNVLFSGAEGRIGNTAYVAGYLIFHIYFSLLLFFKEENRIYRWFYLMPLIVFLPAFYKADSSGGFVGLGFSLLCLLFLYGVLNKNKQIKRISLGLAILGIIFLVFSFSSVKKEPFSDYAILKPIREISLEKNTFQTRLISWRAALKGVPENPFYGTGYGNFAIVFDKYFDANFYTHTSSETFFDRAHNNLIDILATTGLIGLLTYCIFVLASFCYLIAGYVKEKIKLHDFVIVFCLLIAYLVQNLAVFDSLVTYMSLMITLAYVYWLYQRGDETEAVSERRGLLNKEILILFIAGLMSVMVIHQYNFKVYKMLDSTFNALSIVSSGNLAGGYQSFRNTMEKYDTPLNRDSRFMFVRSFMSGLASNEKALNHLPTQEKEEVLEFMLDMAHQNIELAPHDTIANLQMAQAYNLVAIMYQDIKPELSSVYLSRSFEYINIALDLSPERLTTFFTKSQMLLNVGKTQEAIDLLEYGLTLNDEYHDTHCNLAPIYITIGNEERGYELLDYCIDRGGLRIVNSVNFLNILLQHYATTSTADISSENFPRVIKIYEQMTKLSPNDSKSWIDLIKLYEIAGRYQDAIRAAEKAAEIDPSLNNAVRSYIRDLENKIN